LFCNTIKKYGTDDAGRIDAARSYDRVRNACAGVISLPKYVFGPVQPSGYNSISFPGIDCSGKHPRLIPE
jgi:hypothetical protein